MGVADQREVAFAGLDRPARDVPTDDFFQHRPDGLAPLRVELIARQPDECEQLALEDAAHEQERRPWAVGQRHRHHHQVVDRVPADVDEQVSG